MKNKEFRNQARILFSRTAQSILVFSPMFVGFCIFVISGGNPLVFSLGAFVAGFTGIIVIVKKEIPAGITVIQGTKAVVEGILLTIICWGSAIILLVEAFKLNP